MQILNSPLGSGDRGLGIGGDLIGQQRLANSLTGCLRMGRANGFAMAVRRLIDGRLASGKAPFRRAQGHLGVSDRALGRHRVSAGGNGAIGRLIGRLDGIFCVSDSGLRGSMGGVRRIAGGVGPCNGVVIDQLGRIGRCGDVRHDGSLLRIWECCSREPGSAEMVEGSGRSAHGKADRPLAPKRPRAERKRPRSRPPDNPEGKHGEPREAATFIAATAQRG